MPDPTRPEQPIDPEAEIEPTPDEGEQLLRKTTHEIEPGDMTASTTP